MGSVIVTSMPLVDERLEEVFGSDFTFEHVGGCIGAEGDVGNWDSGFGGEKMVEFAEIRTVTSKGNETVVVVWRDSKVVLVNNRF